MASCASPPACRAGGLPIRCLRRVRTWELAAAGHARHVGVMLFPELGLSSYAIDDLLLQDVLLDGAEAAVAEIVAASADLLPVLVVGAPLRHGTVGSTTARW